MVSERVVRQHALIWTACTASHVFTSDVMKAHHLIQLLNVIVGGGRQRQGVIVLGHI